MRRTKYTLEGLRKPLIYGGVALITYFPQPFTSPERLDEIIEQRTSEVVSLKRQVEENGNE